MKTILCRKQYLGNKILITPRLWSTVKFSKITSRSLDQLQIQCRLGGKIFFAQTIPFLVYFSTKTVIFTFRPFLRFYYIFFSIYDCTISYCRKLFCTLKLELRGMSRTQISTSETRMTLAFWQVYFYNFI